MDRGALPAHAGSGGDNSCPAADNTLGEMAVFVGKTFALE